MSDEFDAKVDRLLELEDKFYCQTVGLDYVECVELAEYKELCDALVGDLARRYKAQQAEIKMLRKTLEDVMEDKRTASLYLARADMKIKDVIVSEVKS